MTVYRGQDSEPTINRLGIRGFLSTTKNKAIAVKEFSKGGCCVFTIHVESDVPSLDVYKFIDKGSMGHEEEVLLPEGGYFYSDSTLKTQGFRKVSGEYETWYTMKAPPPELTLEAALARIPEDEYDMIETPDDIYMGATPISNELRNAIFQRIKGQTV